MITDKFLRIKIPVHPYQLISRGPSTKYGESFHIKGVNGKQLNIHLCPIREQVTVTIFDPSKDKWNTHKEVYRGKSFSSKKIPFELIK